MERCMSSMSESTSSAEAFPLSITYCDIFMHVSLRIFASWESFLCLSFPRIWRIMRTFVVFTVFSTASCGIGMNSIFVLFFKLAGRPPLRGYRLIQIFYFHPRVIMFKNFFVIIPRLCHSAGATSTQAYAVPPERIGITI